MNPGTASRLVQTTSRALLSESSKAIVSIVVSISLCLSYEDVSV